MMDVKKLLNSKRVEVSVMDVGVDVEFIKSFRNKHSLTQVALANILGVSKKTVERWECGICKMHSCAAILLKLLNDNPELIGQLYSVSVKEE